MEARSILYKEKDGGQRRRALTDANSSILLHQNKNDLVGYTLDDLVKHLESKFDDKMSWNNYGSYWHVDHKVPIAAFDYTSYEDEAFKRCWSLENLQPLKNLDNLLKRDTISEEWNNVELAAQLL